MSVCHIYERSLTVIFVKILIGVLKPNSDRVFRLLGKVMKLHLVMDPVIVHNELFRRGIVKNKSLNLKPDQTFKLFQTGFI